MFYAGYLCLASVVSLLVIDWSQLRALVPATLTGMLIAGLPMAVTLLELPYQFVDTLPFEDHWLTFFAMQMVIIPVLAVWFLQGVPSRTPFPLKRILLFTLLMQSLELMFSSAGKLVYSAWWGPYVAASYQFAFFSVIAWFHWVTATCLRSPQGDFHTVHEVRSSSVLPAPGPSDLVRGQMDH